MEKHYLRTPLCVAVLGLMGLLACIPAHAASPPRKMENLGRGVVAVRKNTKDVFISWRLLGLDPADIKFNVYRSANAGAPVKLNSTPLGGGTNYTDSAANLAQPNAYTVRAIIGGAEQIASGAWTLPAHAVAEPLFRIPLKAPHDHRVYNVWVGDLDGDGEYEFIVCLIAGGKQEAEDKTDAEAEAEAEKKGETKKEEKGQSQKLQAYKRDGTFLWEVDFGPNSVNSDNIWVKSATVAAGQWDGVTVYDLDSDGRAEVIVKSANGVTFGDGKALKHSDDFTQYISILDGLTGAERTRAVLPNPWKNRTNSYIKAPGLPLGTLFGIGYPDGINPSLMIHAKNRNPSKSFNAIDSAWDFRDGKLTERWSIKHDGDDRGSSPHGHQMRVVDMDGDGKDELVPGMHVISSEGKLLYSLGDQGVVHGDRFHIGDLDPTRPGLEYYGIQQNNQSGMVEYFCDAKTGKMLWTVNIGKIADAARGTASDVDPRHPGFEFYSFYGMHTAKGEKIADKTPYPNMQIWWDGDELGENLNEKRMEKWDHTTQGIGRVLTLSNFGGYANARRVPPLYGDIMGDWREEIIVGKTDNSELIVFTTNIPTDIRLYTLAHNPAYRNCLTVKGYYQQNLPDYFLGHGMKTPLSPNIVYVKPAAGIPSAVTAAARPEQTLALQQRMKTMAERQRAQQAGGLLSGLQGQPRALLIVKGSDGKAQLVRANAVTAKENLVVAELSGGGKAAWQKQFVERQLPWHTSVELESGAVNTAELLASYLAVGESYPELKPALAAEAAAVTTANAKLEAEEAERALKAQEEARQMQLQARFAALAEQKYDPAEDYGMADLESMVADAELLGSELPGKAAEIESKIAPFRQHLQSLQLGKKLVNGVWLALEERAIEALVQRLQEQPLPGTVMTDQEWMNAWKLPATAVAALALGGFVLIFPKKTRWLGILFFISAVGTSATYWFLAKTAAKPKATATTDQETRDARKVARLLLVGARAIPNSEADPLTLSADELNAFLRELIKIDTTNAIKGSLQRTSLSVQIAPGKIVFYEGVRRDKWQGMVCYELKVASGGERDRITVDSVRIGSAPVKGTLKNVLWERLSGALGKVLSPGIEGLQIKSLEQGTMALTAVPASQDALAGTTPESP